MPIPKIFHQIWINNKAPELPERFAKYRDTWLINHPGWEYKLWNLDNLDFDPFRPELIKQAPNNAQIADILRYEILYRHGGVYIDTDFENFKSIEQLIVGVENFSCSEDGSNITNAIIGASKGSLYMRRCLDALPERVGIKNTAEETGPALLTQVLLSNGMDQDFVLFPQAYFYPYSWTEMHLADNVFPDAYAAHHWAHSWGGDTLRIKVRRQMLKLVDLLVGKI